MWSETVGLRTRPVNLRPKKIGLGLCLGLAHCDLGLGHAGLVLCCLVTLVVMVILKDTATFQVLFIVSLFCARNNYYCGDQQWRSLT